MKYYVLSPIGFRIRFDHQIIHSNHDSYFLGAEIGGTSPALVLEFLYDSDVISLHTTAPARS